MNRSKCSALEVSTTLPSRTCCRCHLCQSQSGPPDRLPCRCGGYGVSADGNREALGLDVGDSEDEVFWTQFLRSLKDRGLDGVHLVISDAHTGLKNAIACVFQGASWQRCKVHLMRNLLAHVPKHHKEMIAATVRTVFAQPDPESTRDQLRQVVGALRSPVRIRPSRPHRCGQRLADRPSASTSVVSSLVYPASRFWKAVRMLVGRPNRGPRDRLPRRPRGRRGVAR
jgi:hypothetical protein